MWIPASAGMTNRSHQIQANLNLVASLAITATIQEFSDSLRDTGLGIGDTSLLPEERVRENY